MQVKFWEITQMMSRTENKLHPALLRATDFHYGQGVQGRSHLQFYKGHAGSGEGRKQDGIGQKKIRGKIKDITSQTKVICNEGALPTQAAFHGDEDAS